MGVNEPVISKTVEDEKGRLLTLDYFVTHGLSLTDGAEGKPAFGIRVQMSTDGKDSDVSQIDDVTPSKETATRMAQLFANFLVTPTSLRDVVEDCLSAQL